MTALIHFRCRATEHQVPGAGSALSPITFHEHLWAYCPLGVSEGHDWEKLEVGRLLKELQRTSFSEARLL